MTKARKFMVQNIEKLALQHIKTAPKTRLNERKILQF